MHDLTCSQEFLGIQSLVQKNSNHIDDCPKQTNSGYSSDFLEG
jgi:hypothetical protein